jgi:hypothetical protein
LTRKRRCGKGWLILAVGNRRAAMRLRRGVLALVEGDVGDLLEELGVASEIADMAPGDLVRGHLEVVVAERLEAGEPLVDFGLLREDGVHRLLLVGLRGRACHPRHPSARWRGGMNRFSPLCRTT